MNVIFEEKNIRYEKESQRAVILVERDAEYTDLYLPKGHPNPWTK